MFHFNVAWDVPWEMFSFKWDMFHVFTFKHVILSAFSTFEMTDLVLWEFEILYNKIFCSSKRKYSFSG